jgi:hypothetical protein
MLCALRGGVAKTFPNTTAMQNAVKIPSSITKM